MPLPGWYGLPTSVPDPKGGGGVVFVVACVVVAMPSAFEIAARNAGSRLVASFAPMIRANSSKRGCWPTCLRGCFAEHGR